MLDEILRKMSLRLGLIKPDCAGLQAEDPKALADKFFQEEERKREVNYLLTCLAEECMEVAQRATKAIRFGLYEVQPGQPHSNAERLRLELDDLGGVLNMLADKRIFEYVPDEFAMIAKIQKLTKFMQYSREQGCL